MNRALPTWLLLTFVFVFAGHAQTPERELEAYRQALAVYQQSLLRAASNLRRRRDADSLAAAALFSVRSEPADALRLIEQARAVAPGRPELTLLHIQVCPGTVGCDAKPIELALRKQDPKNAFGWYGDLARAYEAQDDEALDAAIAAAGSAPQFNTYFLTLVANLSEVIAKSESMPLSEAIIAVAGEIAGFGLPSYLPGTKGCAVERLQRPGLLDSCRQLAASLMAGDTVIAEMIGVTIAKRVWQIDSMQWQSAVEARRVYKYRSTALSNVESTLDWDEANAADYLDLIKAHPREQDALVAQLVAQDIDPVPPNNWREPAIP